MTVIQFLNTSPWVWPICFITNQFIPILALAFTQPKSPIRRLTMLFAVISAGLFSHTVSNFAPGYADLRATAMVFTCAFLLNNNDLLNLTGMSYEQHVAWKNSSVAIKLDRHSAAEKREEKANPNSAGGMLIEDYLWQRFKWSFGMCWNFRRIGTQYQISKVNPFSIDDPSYVPSRKNFLLRTLLMLVLSKCMIDLSDWVLEPSDRLLYLWTRPYLRFFPRLFDVSFSETAFRSLQVLGYWLGCGMAQFHCYELLALICVGLGIQDPQQWPPYFGFASETWSVRQFWGSVWHQTFRLFLTPNVDYFVFSIMKFPRGSLVTRYTRLMLSFLISGLMHLAMEHQHGYAKGEAGSVNFFVSQAVGIILEDGAHAIGRTHFPNMGQRLKRWIGYVWVAAFLLETTPIWFYSQSLYFRTLEGTTVTYPNFKTGKGAFEGGSRFGDLELGVNFSMFGQGAG